MLMKQLLVPVSDNSQNRSLYIRMRKFSVLKEYIGLKTKWLRIMSLGDTGKIRNHLVAKYKMICKTIKVFVSERNLRKSRKKILIFHKTIRREIKIFIEDRIYLENS